MNKKKLLLINPQSKYKKGFSLTRSSKYIPLGLGIIAALTPKNWEIELIDELFEPFTYRDADIVAFTSFTANVNRAYELAALYRKNNITTVMGGIHATMQPEEAMRYMDIIVTGEAEYAWPQLIKDFENGTTKNIYKGEHVDLKDVPIARHDLWHKDHIFGSIQTSRGCPMSCDFCSVHKFNGNKHRLRPVENVLDEMEKMPEKQIFILDDNFYGHSQKSREHAYAILEGMISRGIKKQWFTQTSLNVGDDKKFLKLAAKSGCRTLLVGIEAEELDQLNSINKKLNIKIGTDHFKQQIKSIQKAGIAVLGTFIFGLDIDTPEHFNKRADFINKIGVDSIQTSLLTPLPGTTLFERAMEENKIIKNNYPEDWKHYNFTESALLHPTMTTDEIHYHMAKAWQKLYNKTNLRKHFLKTWLHTKSFTTAYWSYVGNWQYRRIVFEDIGYSPDIPIDKQKKQ